MIAFFCIIALVVLSTGLFFQLPSFGAKPKGARLERIRNSPNYRNGSFQNQSHTPMMADDASMLGSIMKFIRAKNTKPKQALPSQRHDLKQFISDKPVIIWFGHSSYLLQINGLNILVDPVFSQRTSPVQFAGTKGYEGTSIHTIEDFPFLDYVFITHDHYDHLDYESIKKLKSKTGHFYTALGVGVHLEKWGISSDKITEFDWWEETTIGNTAMKLISAPARHFSNRGISRKYQTLWTSFILITPQYKIYLGGDSGYDKHFKEIGDKFGPFDIAILESGQYDHNWQFIHMMPEQTVQAAMDLKAKVLLPVHWGKFSLSVHPWTDPIERVLKAAENTTLKVTTPMLGEKIIIGEHYPDGKWWREI